MEINKILEMRHMRIVVLFLFIGIAANLNSQDIPISELAFQHGERVTYKVYYNWKFIWVPAGEVTFVVDEKPDLFEFNVEGISYESYDSFFKVRDYYVSRANKENLIPADFRRDILEGNYQRYDSLSFDQSEYQVLEYFGKTRATAREFTFELEDKVLDMVSAIYYLRSLPSDHYKDGKDIDLRIFFDKEQFNIHIRNLGIEKKKIKSLGKLSCIRLQPELITGYVFKEGDLMDIWVSNDDNKLPLQIESPISFGSVKVILKSAENLKYNSSLTELIE